MELPGQGCCQWYFESTYLSPRCPVGKLSTEFLNTQNGVIVNSTGMRELGCQAKIHTLFILICTLSYAAINTYSHVCLQLSPPYTVLIPLWVDNFKCAHTHTYFSPFNFYHVKKVEQVPRDQIKIFLSFKHLPKQISATTWAHVDNEGGVNMP